ncbi:hypothetical protein C8Q73DRAFT_709411 [Cubamyces lactineus]|nr:hypothetical protein C8Q73DRAFT_709411 [Cubamyces lactineus]
MFRLDALSLYRYISRPQSRAAFTSSLRNAYLAANHVHLHIASIVAVSHTITIFASSSSFLRQSLA